MIRRLILAAVPILAGWAGAANAAVAVADRARLWTEGSVPFVICEAAEAGNLGCADGGRPLAAAEAAKVRAAVEEWNSLFGEELQFVAVDRLERDRRGVLFSRSARETACSTDRIGRPRAMRRTSVKIGAHCNRFASLETPVGTVLHEMMHVAGFYHEHQRPDRDAYLRPRVPDGFFEVLFDVGGAHQWARGPRMRLRMLTPYDFGSIMHYPVKDPRRAVLTEDGQVRLEAQGLEISSPGRRDGLSADDIAGLKLLYAPRRTDRWATARGEDPAL